MSEVMTAVPKIVLGSHYLAFVLTEACRRKLLKLYAKFHEVHVCHHVTIQYGIVEEKIEYLQQLVDSNPRLEVNCLVTVWGSMSPCLKRMLSIPHSNKNLFCTREVSNG